MKFLVVSTCHRKGWEQYGRMMARTFHQHWPEHVPFHMYAEGFSGTARHTIDVPAIKAFKEAPFHPAAARGVVNGVYNFRFDAIRFCHKVFVIEHAMNALPADVQALIWIDADTLTHQDVPASFIDSLLPANADVAFLSRKPKHSETGFVIFRNNSVGRQLVHDLADMYRSGDVYTLPEWHDAYVFDFCRERLKPMGLRGHSLSGGFESHGHPFVNGPLGQYMDHLKGKRKDSGRSKAKDIVNPERTEAHWA